MRAAVIASMSVIAFTSSAYAAPRDIIGGAMGTQTVHACPSQPMTAANYMDSPASARIVTHKLAMLGYVDRLGKGRKHKGAASAVTQFQRDMLIQEKGVGPRTALALAQATAPDRHTARCLQLAMK